jgi:two-component system chemotaxis response regulator CheY
MTTKVLVIDDSMMVRQQVKRALGPDFTVTEASDGIEGLEKLSAAPDTALVILDFNMPKMNGIEFLESRGEKAHLAQVPVVMLTTEGQAQLIQRAKSLGAKAWLVKPFKPDNLLAVARKATTPA